MPDFLAAIWEQVQWLFSGIANLLFRRTIGSSSKGSPERLSVPSSKDAEYYEETSWITVGSYHTFETPTNDLKVSLQGIEDISVAGIVGRENTVKAADLHFTPGVTLCGGEQVERRAVNNFLVPEVDSSGQEGLASVFSFLMREREFWFYRVSIKHIDPNSQRVEVSVASASIS